MLMRGRAVHQKSQNNTAQIASERGAANRKPRAKLERAGFPLRRTRASVGIEESGMMVTLSIVVIDLLLLVQGFHTGFGRAAASFRRMRNPAQLAVRACKGRKKARRDRHRGWADRIGQEIADAAFLVGLACMPKGQGRRNMAQAIAIRARSNVRRHEGIVLRLAAFVCMCLMAPRLALAEAPEVVTPIELFDPDSGEGIRVASGLLFYPQATAELTYDSNIYNVEAPKTEDGFLSFRPSFTLRSDFSRHAVRLEGTADIRRHFDITDEDSEQYRLSALGLLQLGQGIDVEPKAGIARGIERRGTAGDVFFTDKPVVFHDKWASLDIARTGRRFEVAAGGTITRRGYSDTSSGGVPIDLSLRDVTVRTARLRTDYGLNTRTRAFAEVSGNEIDYRISTTPSRNSSGFAVLAGVRHEVTALVDLEAGIGFLHQDFANPSVKSASKLNFRLAASWTPEPKWRLTASANRVVDPSRGQESPAIITTDFKLTAQRALGDRVLLGAEVGYLEEKFSGTLREDKRAFVNASAVYRLMDKAGLVLSAGYRDQAGGDFGRSYSGFAASVGLRAAW